MPRVTIKSKQMDEERALYHLTHGDVIDCIFAGPSDGESALKETRDIAVSGCRFSLRYPLWHAKGFSLENSSMDERARAALWYAENGTIRHCDLEGIKAVRECSHIQLTDCHIHSSEFGWKCEDILLEDSAITTEYPFLDSRNVKLRHVQLNGKYSFQYVENLEITDCTLDTKDAFWHTKNATVKDSTIRGEYLGWFSDGLTLINCRIIGTQPLCYCKNLTLINCTMEDCNLAFEYSEVSADIRGHIDSVKNPKSGIITADSVGEIIRKGAVMDCTGQVQIRSSHFESISSQRLS